MISRGILVACLVLGGAVAEAGVSPRSPVIFSTLNQLRHRPASTERFVHESRLLFYLAESITSNDSRVRIFSEGMKMADQALAKDPKSVSALFWKTRNRDGLVRSGKEEGQKVFNQVVGSYHKVLRQNPDYEYGGPHRALGRFYQGRSKQKAKQHFLDALRIAPEFPGNRIAYARFLYDVGEKSEARKIAKDLINSPIISRYPQYRYEGEVWLQEASKILEGAP